MKVSKGLGDRGGDASMGWGDDEKNAALPRVAPLSVGANFKSNTEESKK